MDGLSIKMADLGVPLFLETPIYNQQFQGTIILIVISLTYKVSICSNHLINGFFRFL